MGLLDWGNFGNSVVLFVGVDRGGITCLAFLRVATHGLEGMLVFFLDNVVVGDVGLVTCFDNCAFEQERASEYIVPLDCAVFLQNDCVDIWDEEQGGQDSTGSSSTDSNTSDLDRSVDVL